MAIITNIKQVANTLAKKAIKNPNVIVNVGYTAKYALHVHERTDIPHVNGEAKFLEKPARERRKDIVHTIIKTMKFTGNLTNSLVMGGLFLQRESQKLVPVDTGNLKGSAFTRKREQQ